MELAITLDGPDVQRSSYFSGSPYPVEYLHLLHRGRLRLGMIRQLWKMFFANLLSFGLAAWPQSRRLYWELVWHLEGSGIRCRKVLPALMPLPVLNLYSAWRLGSLIRELEKQNQYQEIQMSKVFAFSLFPPLLIFYLQNLANRHWLAHARSYQRAEFAPGKSSAFAPSL